MESLFHVLIRPVASWVLQYVPAMIGWRRWASSLVIKAREAPFWTREKAFAQERVESRAMESFIVDKIEGSECVGFSPSWWNICNDNDPLMLMMRCWSTVDPEVSEGRSVAGESYKYRNSYHIYGRRSDRATERYLILNLGLYDIIYLLKWFCHTCNKRQRIWWMADDRFETRMMVKTSINNILWHPYPV